MPGFNSETFEHIADIGIRGTGETMEDAFVGGAMAMMDVMFDLSHVEEKEMVHMNGSSFDEPTLFVEWLNMILTQRDLKELVFCRFRIKVERHQGGEPSFKGSAWGEPYDPAKHEARTEVKAATYSQLKVAKDNESGKWTAQCIVDV